jgi:hypothetical protein
VKLTYLNHGKVSPAGTVSVIAAVNATQFARFMGKKADITIEASNMSNHINDPKPTALWTKPVPTVLTRRNEEVVLESCKSNSGYIPGPSNVFLGCLSTGDFPCGGCSDLAPS